LNLTVHMYIVRGLSVHTQHLDSIHYVLDIYDYICSSLPTHFLCARNAAEKTFEIITTKLRRNNDDGNGIRAV
jgi:hypothetical protein